MASVFENILRIGKNEALKTNQGKYNQLQTLFIRALDYNK